MAYANVRGNMPLWTKIYAIYGTVTEPVSRRKSLTHRNIIDAMLRSEFSSPKNALGDGPKFCIFFRINGYELTVGLTSFTRVTRLLIRQSLLWNSRMAFIQLHTGIDSMEKLILFMTNILVKLNSFLTSLKLRMNLCILKIQILA